MNAPQQYRLYIFSVLPVQRTHAPAVLENSCPQASHLKSCLPASIALPSSHRPTDAIPPPGWGPAIVPIPCPPCHRWLCSLPRTFLPRHFGQTIWCVADMAAPAKKVGVTVLTT